MKYEDVEKVIQEFNTSWQELKALEKLGPNAQIKIFKPVAQQFGRTLGAIEFIQEHNAKLDQKVKDSLAFLERRWKQKLPDLEELLIPHGHSLDDVMDTINKTKKEFHAEMLAKLNPVVPVVSAAGELAKKSEGFTGSIKNWFRTEQHGGKLAGKWAAVGLCTAFAGWGAYKLLHKNKDKEQGAEGAAR